MRNSYRVLSGISEVRIPLEAPTRRYEDIKVDLKDTEVRVGSVSNIHC
jgi:hypothetical protein